MNARYNMLDYTPFPHTSFPLAAVELCGRIV
jgi:hypothetical protein